MDNFSESSIKHATQSRGFYRSVGYMLTLLALALLSCTPKEPIELRQVKDVVADASSEPTLKAQVLLYNPNNVRMKLRKIKIDVYINGKKTGEVDQDFNMKIPAAQEFTVPLEVKLAMKDFGVLDTVLGMISGKKLDVHYKGALKINYKGLPIRVPVDYKSEIRIKI